ncbi:MAG: tRNA (guanosine(46)-N7)-methyltransferase TrmB [Methylococcaceae bacterium]|nr:tRNA (guanosine(46)-N7)-methyltransferase TrmB [Methylococcaceae bacterium]
MSSTEPSITPKIRSFIRRQGRITLAQEQALEKFSEKYCLDPKVDYDFIEVFGRDAPLLVEIGFGNGDSLAHLATANPEKNFIGIEVHRPGVGHLLLKLEQNAINNVRIYCHDAIEVFEQRIPDNGLDAVHLFFPDPWPKKKHHKRRIVRPSFVELLIKKLNSHGYFHAATDWEHYAEAMLEQLSASRGLTNVSKTGAFCERPDYRPLTKFEQRGMRLGHAVWDLIFRKAE